MTIDYADAKTRARGPSEPSSPAGGSVVPEQKGKVRYILTSFDHASALKRTTLADDTLLFFE